MTLGLKFILCLNGKRFDFKKTLSRYYGFSVAINLFLWGVSITRMDTNRNCSTYTIIQYWSLKLYETLNCSFGLTNMSIGTKQVKQQEKELFYEIFYSTH